MLKESKARKKNLALGWIDYKEAYDMINGIKICITTPTNR